MLDRFLPFIFIITTVCSCPLLDLVKKSKSHITDKEVFIKQIKAVDCDDEDRLREVEKLFAQVGADDSAVQIEKYDDATNIVVTVKGKTDETVVVGGHYDKTTLGCGVIDNWTGIVILANLYKNLKNNKSNQKTYKFIAFGKEEENLVGSKAFVDELTESEKKNYCAMVNFDSFGFTDTWTLGTISDQSMITLAKVVAQDRNVSFQVKNFKGASSDSKSFQNAEIPAITLSGLDDDWRDYLHQEKDQLEYIDFEKVFDNFEFSLEYIRQIDLKPCDSLKK